MKIKILVLSACLLLPFQLVTADIEADFQAGMKAPKVLSNAMAGEMSIDDAVTQMISLYPKRLALIITAAVKASPEDAGIIVAAAVSVQCNDASNSVIKTQCENTITLAAFTAGADPTVILAAAAAGSTSRSITTSGSSPAPGGGGGEVASPS